MLKLRIVAIAAAVVLAGFALNTNAEDAELYVTSTAYNSVAAQTDDTPSIAAWGDRLEPGMKVIAVSRDLLELGLTRGTRIRIEGMIGEFVVLDKMSKRWEKRIDIYMGEDVHAARQYGKRFVRIRWQAPEGSSSADLGAVGAAPPTSGD